MTNGIPRLANHDSPVSDWISFDYLSNFDPGEAKFSDYAKVN
jgi:hypothetical protein